MVMVSIIWMIRTRTLVWPESITVGAILIAGHYAIRTAPEFSSGTSADILWVIRAAMATPGIGLLLALVRIQAEHVQQNCGNIRHHDEWNEHDKP